MSKPILETMTVEQCAQITGMVRNHAAHTVHTTRMLYHGIQHVPIGNCPGRHEHISPAVPADPFHGIDDDNDRDL